MTVDSHSAIVDAAVAMILTKAQRSISRHYAMLPCQTIREHDTYVHTIKVLSELTPVTGGIQKVVKYENKESSDV